MRPLKLPTQSPRKRIENRELWNEARSADGADFFTIGYEGRPIDDLMSLMQKAGIRSVLDIRYSPVSRYRPELSKRNFQERIEREGLQYIHIPEWGVPREIRVKAIAAGTRDPIWEWYDTYVVDRFFSRNLHWFLNLEHPVAMVCVETDPTECHRHRLFFALERHGLRGFDL